MREILFRGKRLIYGGWIEGYLIVKDERTYIVQNSAPISRFYYPEKRLICGFYEVKPSTVGQYTGLVDKHGKRIFEDDVVRLYPGEEYEKTARVIMPKGCWILEFKDDWDFLDTNLHHLEVIGNIHDNPELLKEG